MVKTKTIYFIAFHRSHSTDFSPCNACRTSFHLHAKPHFEVSSFLHYLGEHVHFSSINIHTVHIYACSYIYILLLLYIFQSQKRIYNPAYLRGWHMYFLFGIYCHNRRPICLRCIYAKLSKCIYYLFLP